MSESIDNSMSKTQPTDEGKTIVEQLRQELSETKQQLETLSMAWAKAKSNPDVEATVEFQWKAIRARRDFLEKQVAELRIFAQKAVDELGRIVRDFDELNCTYCTHGCGKCIRCIVKQLLTFAASLNLNEPKSEAKTNQYEFRFARAQEALNRIEDYFEYSNESLKDRKKVQAILKDYTESLRKIQVSKE
jgi:hypothetical protein